MTPEGRVKKMVKKALDHLGPDCWRFMPVQGGYGSVALDFLLSIRGRFVAIETKAPGNKLTPLQEQTKAAIEAAGGLVFVVWDETSLELAMKIILALEFAPRGPQLETTITNVSRIAGYPTLAVKHGTKTARAYYKEHERAQQSAQAPDPAVGGDHGASGAQPERPAQPRPRGKDQRLTATVK